MKKLLIFALVIALLTVSIVSADACAIQNLCYNQNNNPYCSPQDTTCTYKDFSLENGLCVATAETIDTDGDGWTLSCDANDENKDVQLILNLPQEAAENETLEENTSEVNDTKENIEEPINETEENTTTQRSDYKKKSTLDNEGEVYLVEKQEPELLQEKEEENNIIKEEEPTKQHLTINTTLPEELKPKTTTNQITGMVTGADNTLRNNWVLWVLGLFLASYLFLLVWKRKQKKE